MRLQGFTLHSTITVKRGLADVHEDVSNWTNEDVVAPSIAADDTNHLSPASNVYIALKVLIVALPQAKI